MSLRMSLIILDLLVANLLELENSIPIYCKSFILQNDTAIYNVSVYAIYIFLISCGMSVNHLFCKMTLQYIMSVCMPSNMHIYIFLISCGMSVLFFTLFVITNYEILTVNLKNVYM